MPVIPPKTLKVLADQDFKDLIFSLCEEIAHLSKLSSDLERVRSIINTNSAKKAGSNIGFFKITDVPAGNFGSAKKIVTSENSPIEIQGHIYQGKFFTCTPYTEEDEDPKGYGGDEIEQDPKITTGQVLDMTGIDTWSKRNDPIIIPEQAEIINARTLNLGTILMAQKLTENLCVFSSCNPRLNVDCLDTEGVTLAGKTAAMNAEDYEQRLQVQQERLDTYMSEREDY